MRLINTTTHELEEFYDERVPEYAILSHTWGDGEVSFQEWRAYNASQRPALDDPLQLKPAPQWVQRFEEKAGFKKIAQFCALCQQEGYGWAWVDTCCIDKTSSAELSEAINSMFRWYSRSQYCCGYLSDVRDEDFEWVGKSVADASLVRDKSLPSPHFDRYRTCGFAPSRWFKRGWTLQELLAPSQMGFFDADWKLIGQRRDLSRIIEGITSIPADRLEHLGWRWRYSVAQKMSWASSRITTRAEDAAYSLLGLFDINMPLLYGEGGARAFRRLQEEIIKVSTDHSIFAWSEDPNHLHTALGGQYDIFAESPAVFKGAADTGDIDEVFFRDINDLYRDIKKSFSLTNFGLSIELPLIPCPRCQRIWNNRPEHRCYLALLDCFTQGDWPCRIGIYLQQDRDGRFFRVHRNNISRNSLQDEDSVNPETRLIHIRTN